METSKINETQPMGENNKAREGAFPPTPNDLANPSNIPKGVIAYKIDDTKPSLAVEDNKPALTVEDERPIARIYIRKWAVVVDIVYKDTVINTKFLRYEEIDVSHDSRFNVRYVRIITPSGRTMLIDKHTYRYIDLYYQF